jgi:opacity protein-like surface antigen
MKSRSVFAVFVLALSFIAAPALAAGPYVGGNLSAVFLSTSTFVASDNAADRSDLKSKTGFGLGLVGGYDFGTWRAEGEFAYRKNNNKEITFAGDPTEPVSGDLSSMALMVNGYYDFRTVSPTVVPYLGAGIGGATVKAKLIHQDGSTIIDKSDTVFAYQLAAGVGYAISKELTLDLGYKYFATAKPEFKGDDGTKGKGEYASHNIFLGARYGF